MLKTNTSEVLKTNTDHDDSVDSYNQSDYYDLASLESILQKNEQKFSCISLNVESLKSKFNQLNVFFNLFLSLNAKLMPCFCKKPG